MSTDAAELRDLFVDVTGEEATTEEQEEGPSRDPIDEEVERVERAVEVARDDGLDDAVAGTEAETGGNTAAD